MGDFFRICLHNTQNLSENEFPSASIFAHNLGFSYKLKPDDVLEIDLFKDGKKIDLNDAMMAKLKDDDYLNDFANSFIEKGDENIEELLKLKNGSE